MQSRIAPPPRTDGESRPSRTGSHSGLLFKSSPLTSYLTFYNVSKRDCFSLITNYLSKFDSYTDCLTFRLVDTLVTGSSGIVWGTGARLTNKGSRDCFLSIRDRYPFRTFRRLPRQKGEATLTASGSPTFLNEETTRPCNLRLQRSERTHSTEARSGGSRRWNHWEIQRIPPGGRSENLSGAAAWGNSWLNCSRVLITANSFRRRPVSHVGRRLTTEGRLRD